MSGVEGAGAAGVEFPETDAVYCVQDNDRGLLMSAARTVPGGGFGNVGLGIGGEPCPTKTRPDLCEGMGHPGATYNTSMDLTWCLCGAVITDGDTAVPHIACCGGPLVELVSRPGQPAQPAAAPSAAGGADGGAGRG